MSQYFLWLTPGGEAYACLAQLIDELSEQYQAPRFEPHITLHGGIEGEESVIYEQVCTLTKNLRPISIDFQQLAFGDEYFRCVFFTVMETPDLLEAHGQANVILGKASNLPFFPHLSLLYGVFSKRVKQDIIAACPPDLPQQFLVSEMKLIRVESPNPRDWHVVGTMPLQG